jgi:hypothetical protein
MLFWARCAGRGGMRRRACAVRCRMPCEKHRTELGELGCNSGEFFKGAKAGPAQRMVKSRMSCPPAHRKERDERGTARELVNRFRADFDWATCHFPVQNSGMRILVNISLACVFLASVGLAVFLLLSSKEKETWATLTGILAVIAALIAVVPAVRILQIQEDALRPRPTPYFDLTSRYGLMQLRVKNLGGGVAYNVRLNWKARPIDQHGKEISSLDNISVLLPQDSVSTLVGVSAQVVKRMASTRFEGDCSCKDATGKKYRNEFVCSVDGNQTQLIHDDEMPRALYDLQAIPRQLSKIADLLEAITQKIN